MSVVKMSSRGRVLLLLSMSVAGSATTAFYVLSDGGKPDVAQARLNEYIHQARERLADAPGPLNRVGVDAEKDLGRTSSKEALQAPNSGAPPQDGVQPIGRGSAGTLAASRGPVTNQEVTQTERAVYPRRPDRADRATGIHSAVYAGCHTCSGPRLWFFAEKLGVTRLKRRFTPYPDPADE
jgi:hypothetical protein